MTSKRPKISELKENEEVTGEECAVSDDGGDEQIGIERASSDGSGEACSVCGTTVMTMKLASRA